MTYVVLVILIALWAIVLVPPYLKDRRDSRGTFRMSDRGSLPAMGGPRFGSLQHAGPAIRASVPSSMGGPAVSPLARSATLAGAVGAGAGASNVVRLHPLAVDDTGDVLGAPFGDETDLHQAWEPERTGFTAVPTSTAAARERRRHVLMALTGAAFVTLLFAMGFGGFWVALNVALDAALVGYVILLVRFRQIAAERRSKVEPIRPPVTEQPPVNLQPAPAYLLRSGT